MKNLRSVLFLILILASSAFAQRNFAGKVVEVKDGKTVAIELTGGGKMWAYLQYIDVPESDQPLYAAVRDHLGRMVLGKVVEFRAQRISADVIIAGQLMLGDVDLSQQMLRDGAAWLTPRETSGQEAGQEAEYNQNQMSAKNEKRGVWSVEGLKPAWEHRAELAARQEQERKNEEATREMRERYDAQVAERDRAIKRQAALDAQKNVNARQSVWPNLGLGRIDPSNGLLKEYDPANKVGSVETRDSVLQMTAGGGKTERADFRALLVYRGEEGRAGDGVFLVGFLIRDPNSLFLKANSLQINADKAKYSMSKPTGVTVYGPADKNWKVIFYKFDKEAMQQIAYADKLELRLAGYSATLDDLAKNSLRHLLLASN
jgi:endonuclease YncB( thermonuclease family)